MALWGHIRNANCCCFCQIILIPQMQPTNCCCYSKIVPKMHTTNWCCYCKIILISQMQSANCCSYCKTRWKMHTATAIARWYPQMHTTNCCCYCKIIPKMLIANCCFCKVLMSLRSVVKFAYWKLLLKFKKYNATLTVNILCFPPVHSTKEQRLLQCTNIFSSYDIKFWF